MAANNNQVIITEKLWSAISQIVRTPQKEISNNWGATILTAGMVFASKYFADQTLNSSSAYHGENAYTVGYFYVTEAIVTTSGLLDTHLFERINVTKGTGGNPPKWTLSGEFYYIDYININDKKVGGYLFRYDPSADISYKDGGDTVTISAADRALALKTTNAVKFYLLDKKGLGAPQGPPSAPATPIGPPTASAIVRDPVIPNTTNGTSTTPSTGKSGTGASGKSQPSQSSTSPQRAVAQRELSRTNGRSGKPASPKTVTTPPTASPNESSPTVSPITTVNVSTTSILPTGTLIPADKPYLLQRYVLSENESLPKENVSNIVVMDIVPNSFEFSQLSSAWAEVDRGGTYALTDWDKYNLMKVSFKFVVSARSEVALHNDIVDVRRAAATGNTSLTTSVSVGASTPLDGLNTSIDSQLEIIRKMAMAPFPITMVNCSPYLTNNIRFPYKGLTPEGIAFIINDMSINITRFTQGSIKHASVAEVSVSLTEYISPQLGTLVKLPALKKATYKPGSSEQTQADNNYLSVQEVYGKTASGWPGTPQGNGGTDTAVTQGS